MRVALTTRSGGRGCLSSRIAQCLLALLLIVLVTDITSAEIERLEDRKSGNAAGANFLRDPETSPHLTHEEIVQELSKKVCFVISLILEDITRRMFSIVGERERPNLSCWVYKKKSYNERFLL